MLPFLDIISISQNVIDSTWFPPVNMIYGDLALLLAEGITFPSGKLQRLLKPGNVETVMLSWVYACNPRTWKAQQRDCCEFKASLNYVASTLISKKKKKWVSGLERQTDTQRFMLLYIRKDGWTGCEENCRTAQGSGLRDILLNPQSVSDIYLHQFLLYCCCQKTTNGELGLSTISWQGSWGGNLTDNAE